MASVLDNATLFEMLNQSSDKRCCYAKQGGYLARMEKIWISQTAFGGYNYSAYTDKETVSVRRGQQRTSGHREILSFSINEWNELLDQNGEPSFGKIEELAHEWSH